MKHVHLDLARLVLDHQLVDCHKSECGKVDDLELEGGARELRVTAIVSGPGAGCERLPRRLRSIAKWILGKRQTVVPWKQVVEIGSHVELASEAQRLGLVDAERKVARWIEPVPLAKE
jgi:hypothetical protein